MNLLKNFTLSLIVFSVIIATLFYFIEPYFTGKSSFPQFWIIQAIMILVTMLFHLGLQRSVKAGGQASIRYFMGATSVKLLVFMMIMIIFGLLNKDKAFGFILHFFIFYLFYTVYEVAIAYKHFGPARRNG